MIKQIVKTQQSKLQKVCQSSNLGLSQILQDWSSITKTQSNDIEAVQPISGFGKHSIPNLKSFDSLYDLKSMNTTEIINQGQGAINGGISSKLYWNYFFDHC